MIRFSSRRFWFFVRRTSPLDRVAFGIIVLYALARLARALGAVVPLSSVLGFVSLAAAVYAVIRLIIVARAPLLWSLRNRLIVAYVFMAVVPVILLLTMVGFASYLLELQIGAHLLRDDLQDRISILAADTDAIAAALDVEPDVKPDPPVPQQGPAVADPVLSRPGVATVIDAAQKKWPELRVYLNHGQQLVRTDKGRQFAGLAEYGGRLWFASAEALSIPKGRATVLVIAPITPALLDSLPSKLGPITLTLLEPAADRSTRGLPLDGIMYVPRQQVASNHRALSGRTHWFDFRFGGVATLEASRADVGVDALRRPVLAQFSLRLSAVNKDLLTSLGAIGPILGDLLVLAIFIFVALEIAAFATGTVLARTITRSVADLYDATLHVRRGDFTHRVRVSKRDQLGALGESFNEMTGSIADLIEKQRQHQRLENEIEIAREVQRQLFPRSLPTVPGVELAAVCRPARVVSGDYYDFIPLGPSRVGIALADVSGKGISAALVMASLQAALHSTAMFDDQRGTADLVARLSRHLFTTTSEERYATLFYGVYDAEARTLTYTNAGHLPPFVVSGGRVQQLDQGGTVVGLFEDSLYTQCTLLIEPGSLLVAFSDGLTEPANIYGEEYGIDRLKAEVLRQSVVPPARLAEKLISAVDQWAGAPEQADDITIVVARMG
jgi:sigma-B regulation protein RsbU (phosphoserine phosphatase)